MNVGGAVITGWKLPLTQCHVAASSKIFLQTFNNFFPQRIVSKTDIYYVQFLSCHSKSVTNKTITTIEIIVKICGL